MSRSVGIGVLATLLWTLAMPTASEPVILISADGYRWDHPDLFQPPVLLGLAAEGVRARGLVPTFPPMTFPAHYSVVTGLHPEHHGIVGNRMYDPEIDAWFSISSRESVGDSRWWGGEPIWVTAEKQGLVTATCFWPGSEAEIGGVRPSHWLPFDGSMPGEARVDQVLAWLDLPQAQRPALLTLYFNGPNAAGHEFGPEAPQTADAVHAVDRDLGRLLEGLAARGLLSQTDLVIVSDHGMADSGEDHSIAYEQLLGPDDATLVTLSPVLGLLPGQLNAEEILERLRGKHPHLQAWSRSEVPAHLHHRAHPRIPPVVGLLDEGWNFTYSGSPVRVGTHGYDPRLESMHGILVATGPSIRQGVEIGLVAAVDVYELLCHLLGIEPASNDGCAATTTAMLRGSRVDRRPGACRERTAE